MDRVIGGTVGRYWRTVALVVGTGVLAAIIATIGSNVGRNNQAIEKGCILLQNTVISSLKPQPSTEVLLAVIVAHMTDEEYKRYLAAKGEDDPGFLLTNCSELARNPEKIKAIPVPQSPAPKKK